MRFVEYPKNTDMLRKSKLLELEKPAIYSFKSLHIRSRLIEFINWDAQVRVALVKAPRFQR